MPRPPSAQITRNDRADGSTTFSLRVRVAGADETIPLGNAADGWDEARAERARRQLLAKIELGLWSPSSATDGLDNEREPTFAELASDWLLDRARNPAIRSTTTLDDNWRLKRYLIPFFGQLLPSQITPLTIKEYRRRLHEENEQIRAAAAAGSPLRDSRTRQFLRPLSNESINKTLRTLALILDEAEDAGWVTRNVARGRRMREPVERQRTDALEPHEFLALLEAAQEIDRPHQPHTPARAERVRALRDDEGLTWEQVGRRLGIARSSAMYLYGCLDHDEQLPSPRRAVIATLGLAGLRVSELCALNRQDVDLARGKIHVRDAKTEAGVRVIDIRPRLLEELRPYAPTIGGSMSDRSSQPQPGAGVTAATY